MSKQVRKILSISIPLGAVLLMLFVLDTTVLAQFSPPTLLPAENVDIGGRGGACIGLADMIRSGDIHLRNIPCFIKFFTQTLVGIAGSISVVFIMFGGYRYVVSSEEDAKSGGKKTIIYALIGLAVSLMAWIIIDLVLQVATE